MKPYQMIINSVMVLPKGESIFCDQATTVRIEDEAGGPFLVLEQHPNSGKQEIRFDFEEWPMIHQAVQKIAEQCQLLTDSESNPK